MLCAAGFAAEILVCQRLVFVCISANCEAFISPKSRYDYSHIANLSFSGLSIHITLKTNGAYTESISIGPELIQNHWLTI